MDIIYKITSPTNKVYIGRTSDFNRRMIEHKASASKNCKNTLYKAIRKYGWDNFTKEIICEVEPNIAQKLEEEMIKLNDSVRKGYNDTYNGGGGDYWDGKRDTIEYMEYVEKMRQRSLGTKNGMFGKEHSEEAKQLQKEKAKGRFSLEWFKERNGDDIGTQMYNERCQQLKNRNLNTDSKGRFIKKSK